MGGLNFDDLTLAYRCMVSRYFPLILRLVNYCSNIGFIKLGPAVSGALIFVTSLMMTELLV